MEQIWKAYWKAVVATNDLSYAILDYWNPLWWVEKKRKEEAELKSRMLGGCEVYEPPQFKKK